MHNNKYNCKQDVENLRKDFEMAQQKVASVLDKFKVWGISIGVSSSVSLLIVLGLFGFFSRDAQLDHFAEKIDIRLDQLERSIQNLEKDK